MSALLREQPTPPRRLLAAVADAEVACQRPGPSLWLSEDAEERRRAALLCERCPVRVACLSLAEATEATWGVWGAVDYSVVIEMPSKRPDPELEARYNRARRARFLALAHEVEESGEVGSDDPVAVALRAAADRLAGLRTDTEEARTEVRALLWALSCDGWSWAELAHALGVSKPVAGRMLKGLSGDPTREPDPAALRQARARQTDLMAQTDATIAERDRLVLALLADDWAAGVVAGLARMDYSEVYRLKGRT